MITNFSYFFTIYINYSISIIYINFKLQKQKTMANGIKKGIILALIIVILECQLWTSVTSFQKTLLAGQSFFATKLDIIDESTISVYCFSRMNTNQTLSIYKYTFWEGNLIDFIFSTHGGIFAEEPIINMYKNRIGVSYKQANSSIYRILVLKEDLTEISNLQINKVLKGIYSNRYSLLLNIDVNKTWKIYSGLQNNAVVDQNVNVVQNYQIQYVLACGESKLIMLLEGANFLKIRSMNNAIIQNYSQFRTIQLPNSGFQCFCLDQARSILFILDNNGILIKIDLITQTIMLTRYIAFFNQSKCFYVHLPSSTVVLVKYTYTGSVITQTAFSMYYLGKDTLRISNITNNLGGIEMETSGMYFVQWLNNNFQINSINNTFCQGRGRYYSALECHYCMGKCDSCSNASTCSLCSPNFIYQVASLSCQACPASTYYSPSPVSCINCMANCVACSSPTLCSLCSPNYVINSLTSLCQLTVSSQNEDLYTIPGNIDQLITNTMNSSTFIEMNKFPLSRQIFYYAYSFFGNIDDLWLYQFHQRDYGHILNQLFSSINFIQNQKWKISHLQDIQAYLNINMTSLIAKFDRKKAYSGQKFVASQQKGENLLSNCFYYLTFNLCFVIIVFLILKCLFKSLFQYRISKFLRPYSFWGYIGVIMLDGNMQIMYFLMFSQSGLAFSLDFSDKIINFLSHLIFFFFLIFSIGCYFFYYVMYKKLAKYFLDNSKCSINGILSLVIGCSLRQLILSAIHNFLRNDYEMQLLSLAAVEVAYIVILLVFLLIIRSFERVNIVWVSIIFSFFRVLFNLCLYFQQIFHEKNEITALFEVVIETFLLSYLFIYLMTIVINFIASIMLNISKLIRYYSEQKQKQREAENCTNYCLSALKENQRLETHKNQEYSSVCEKNQSGQMTKRIVIIPRQQSQTKKKNKPTEINHMKLIRFEIEEHEKPQKKAKDLPFKMKSDNKECKSSYNLAHVGILHKQSNSLEQHQIVTQTKHVKFKTTKDKKAEQHNYLQCTYRSEFQPELSQNYQ